MCLGRRAKGNIGEARLSTWNVLIYVEAYCVVQRYTRPSSVGRRQYYSHNTTGQGRTCTNDVQIRLVRLECKGTSAVCRKEGCRQRGFE